MKFILDLSSSRTPFDESVTDHSNLGGWAGCDEIIGYRWRAHRCECEHNCHSPLVVSQVCRDARRIFKRVEGTYTRCFGTYINWERDTLYIGDRTGHLHNTEFLKAVDLAGGLGKVRHLAVHEDVWRETKKRHGNVRAEFKRCGPVGVVQQLGVQHLTIVGKAGFFKDETEFWDEVDEREWLWNSDTEFEEYEEYERRMESDESDSDESDSDSTDEDISEDEQAGREARVHDGSNECTSIRHATASGNWHRTLLEQLRTQTDPSVHIQQDPGFDSADRDLEDDRFTAPSSTEPSSPESSIASRNVLDRWECDAPVVVSKDLRAYKPHFSDSPLEQRNIRTGDSGLALVDFASIPGTPLWENGSSDVCDVDAIKRGYLADFIDAKKPHPQYYGGDDDPDSNDYMDWRSWTPPTLNLAFFRRTGQSCRLHDWKISRRTASPGRRRTGPSDMHRIISKELFGMDITRATM